MLDDLSASNVVRRDWHGVILVPEAARQGLQASSARPWPPVGKEVPDQECQTREGLLTFDPAERRSPQQLSSSESRV